MWLEGWADEVEEQTLAARTVDPAFAVDRSAGAVRPDGDRGRDRRGGRGDTLPDRRPGRRPQRLDALLGVGLVWFGLPDGAEPLDELRVRVAEAAGVAPVIRGAGGLGDGPIAAPTSIAG